MSAATTSAGIALGGIGLAILAGVISAVATPGNNTTTTTTTVPSGQTTGCNTVPSACGFPDGTNTGPQVGATLTVINSASTSGTGWSCNSPCTKWRVTSSLGDATHGFELSAGISMWTAGQNIAVTNLKIDSGALTVCNGNSNGDCSSSTPAANVTLSHCDIGGALAGSGFATNSAPTYGVLVQAFSNTGVPAHGFTMDHCHVHGYQNDVDFNENGPIVLTNDWFNDIRCNSPCTAHINGIYDGGVASTVTPTSLLIQNNTIINDATSNTSGAFSFFSDGGPEQNVKGGLDHNLIEQVNNQCFSTDDGHPSEPTFLYVKNNDFVQSAGCGTGNGILRTFNGGGTAEGWPFVAGGNSPGQLDSLNNYDCGNYWDNGTRAGSGADASNTYPSGTTAIAACPNPLPF